MEQVFKAVLLLSCVGSALAGLLLLLKPLIKRFFTPRWQYGVWLCVLAAMLLPVRFRLPAALPTIQAPLHIEAQTTPAKPLVTAPAAPAPQGETDLHMATALPDIAQNIRPALPYLWLLGAVCALGCALVSYFRLLRALRKSARTLLCPELEEIKARLGIRRRIPFRVTDCTTAPMMAGLFRPVLYLPGGPIGGDELRHVLLHELTHVKRGDLLFKWFALFVRCVHWFNPLVYLVCKELDETCEISCDLAVTRSMDEPGRRSYMGTILSLAAPESQRAPRLATSMAGGRAQIERRFTMIRTAKKPSRLRSALSLLLAAALLSSTVLAGGLAAGAAGIYDNKALPAIEVYNDQIRLSFVNQPFVANDEIYLPLRETLNQFGITDIQWNNGEIYITWTPPKDYHGFAELQSGCQLTIGKPRIKYPGVVGYKDGVLDLDSGYPMRQAPMTQGGTTYVTVDFFEDLLTRSGLMPRFRVSYTQSTNPKDYCAAGEEVFIGTAEEQDRFNPVDENGTPRYVKRIVTNDKGEATLVITAENQRPEVIAATPHVNSASREGYSDTKGMTRTFSYNAYGEGVIHSSGLFLYKRTGENSFQRFAYIPPALQINYHSYQLSDNIP